MVLDGPSKGKDPFIEELEARARADASFKLPVRPSPALSEDVIEEALKGSASDLDCTLCYSLLCQPATMPCGHSFCRSCAIRAIEHSSHTDEPKCPVCRTTFVPLLDALHALRPISQTPPINLPLEHIRHNRALDALINQVFPEESAQRKAQIDEEEAVLPRGLLSPHEKDPMVIGCPVLWIPRIPDTAGIAQSVELSDPAERLMMRRLAMGRLNAKNKDATPWTFGLFYVKELGETPKYGVLCDMEEVGFNMEDFATVIYCRGRCRFEIQHVESRDGYKVARVRLLEKSYKNRAFDATKWKREMKTTGAMVDAIARARESLYRDAPDALLQVAAEFYWAKVKKRNKDPKDDFALEQEHPGGLPYYIAYKLHFSNDLVHFLMFSDATRESFREQLRLVLLLGNPEGRYWRQDEILDARYVLEFPGLDQVLRPSAPQ
jgi:hypothetical protein